jgi:hypothetical protein
MDFGRRAKRVLVRLVRALHLRVGRLADRLDASSRLTDESVAEPVIEDEAQRAPDTGQGTGGPPAHWVNLVRCHAPQLLRPASTGHPLPATTAPATRVRHLPATAIAVGSQPQGAADDDVCQTPQRGLPERRSESPVRQPASTQGAGAEFRRAVQPLAAGYTSPSCEPDMHSEPYRGVPPSVSPVLDFGVRRPLSAHQTSLSRSTLTATAKLQSNRFEPDHRTPIGRPRSQAETATLPTGPTALRDPNDGREHLQRRPLSTSPESALPTGGRCVPNNGAPAAPSNGLSRIPHRSEGHVMCTESQASVGHSGNAETAQVPRPPAARAPLASAGPFSQAVERSASSRTRACDAELPAANKAPTVQRASPFAGDAGGRPVFSEPHWPRLADEPDLAAEPRGGKPSPWPSLPDEAAGQEGLSRSKALRATQQQERVMQRKRTLDIEQRGGFWNV